MRLCSYYIYYSGSLFGVTINPLIQLEVGHNTRIAGPLGLGRASFWRSAPVPNPVESSRACCTPGIIPYAHACAPVAEGSNTKF